MNSLTLAAIAEIARQTMGRGAKAVFSIFLWLAFNGDSGFFFTEKTNLGLTAVVLVVLAGYMVLQGVRMFGRMGIEMAGKA